MIKFNLFLLCFILCFSALNGSVEVKKNPAVPSDEDGKKAGRETLLTEVIRISDDQGGFVFKKPRRIKVAPDGSVFVAGRDKLLQFDSNGRYLRNFLKKGEGPGEVKYFSNFFFTENSVLIGSFLPVKIMFFSLDGKLLRETRVHNVKPFTLLINGWSDHFHFISNRPDFRKAKTGVNIRNNNLIHVNSNGDVTETKLSFATKDALIKQATKHGVRVMMDEITYFLSAFDEKKFLYVSHTERYMISQVDLETGQIIRKFNRIYEPVKFIPKEPEDDEDAKIQSVYKRKSFNDIYTMRVYNGNLLVFTSTIDKDKGVLVDVFNRDGKYTDSFYLKLPEVNRGDDLVRKPLCFTKGYLWTVTNDDDDNPVVVKYKVNL